MAEVSPQRSVTPRALADIHYNSIVNAEAGTSSEEDGPESRTIARGDAQNLVGVSLGRAQTRIKALHTPAGEKAAAIEEAGGFFEGPDIPENVDLDEDSDINDLGKSKDGVAETDSSEERLARRPTRAQTDASTQRLPSPWRAGPRIVKVDDSKYGGLKDGIRRRATLMPGSHKTEGWRESIMASLPSLPKHFTFNSPFSFGSHDEHKSEKTEKSENPRMLRRSGSLFASWTSSPSSTSHPSRASSISSPERRPYNEPRANTSAGPLYEPIALHKTPTRQLARAHSGTGSAHRLRRSTSDTSLQTTLSRAPSLGDDSRFINVQEQVNSRMKAIRDSWQDTNLKLLPSMPNLSSFSHLSLNTLNEKRNSIGSRPSIPNTSRPRDTSGARRHLPRTSSNEATQNHQFARASKDTGKSAQSHPHFTKAVENLTGDVVVLGGYRGSILRSAEPPHRQLWVPIKVGLNIRKVDLEVGLGPEDDERAEEKIYSSGMLTHIGPVDISRRLFKRLRASDNARSGQLRIHDYGYDWRLEPAYLSRRLIEFLEKLPCNQPGTPKEKRGAIVMAHSLGGLITRNAINKRPELFAGVVYAGTPSTCVNILGPFRNGDDVLLSSRVLTAQVNFTIRTSFALLPLNGRCFFNKDTKEEYPVDFFDPQQWIDYRWSPCVARPLPPLSTPNPPTGLAGIMSSVANALPTRKGSISARSKQATQHPAEHATGGLAKPGGMDASAGGANTAVARGNIDTNGTDNLPSSRRISSPSSNVETAAEDQSTSIATAVTMPRDAAIKYLTRILASVKQFKQELAFNQAHEDTNLYPPAAVIYGKTTPTVYGAHVVSREAIKHADAYDNLAFASGDGVVLARAAMLPQGYTPAKGGIVSSERGHVTLLGDLEAVGKCLRAIQIARKKGVGMGNGTEGAPLHTNTTV